ncbi:unnamed protein product [Caenorhabditis sp. 36 PRJEB53466]|nr:unnamed protein product [Caenorhabditis sp. 36 PRJEB53466]
MKTIGICSLRGWRGVLGRNLFVFVAILFGASIVYLYIDFPLRLSSEILNDRINENELYSYEDTIRNAESVVKFNKSSNDVLVFVHIQKTAGTTFEKFLVRYQESLPCKCMAHKKRCNCGRNSSNETWLFSRYSTGWVCGLHADYTELVVNSCVQRVLDKQAGHKKKRNYFYTTFLRNPTDRFISEFRHVQRGATWISSKHVCNGKPASVNDLPTCFDPRIGWEGVSLEEFISCPYNLAFNRQTRMLKMAFFGIKERMEDSQFYFENTFDLKFTRKMSVWGKSKSNDTILTEAQLAYIQNVNKLDWELYEYALKLFDERVDQLRRKRRIRR